MVYSMQINRNGNFIIIKALFEFYNMPDNMVVKCNNKTVKMAIYI